MWVWLKISRTEADWAIYGDMSQVAFAISRMWRNETQILGFSGATLHLHEERGGECTG